MVREDDLEDWLAAKRAEGYTLIGLEQTEGSVSLPSYSFPRKTVLLLGREREGIPQKFLQVLDTTVEIPPARTHTRFKCACQWCHWHVRILPPTSRDLQPPLGCSGRLGPCMYTCKVSGRAFWRAIASVSYSWLSGEPGIHITVITV
eukprot:jgi/Botrbrau1/1893/Bobra.0005s0009.1